VVEAIVGVDDEPIALIIGPFDAGHGTDVHAGGR
jgi:hypothetical protein